MITVAVCTYNRVDLLAETLGHLRRQEVPPGLDWEILVVDNGSSDGTPELVKGCAAETAVPVRYVREERQGVSRARNAAVEAARGDIIAYTDDDVVPEPDWVGAIAEAFETRDCVGVGGRVLERWDFKPPRWWSALRGELNAAIVGFHPRETPGRLEIPPFGANMAFRKDVFHRYGGFRTDLGRNGHELISGEDTEFGRRLLEANETLWYAPGATVHHPVARERATKAYFRRWYYYFGRTLVRRDGVPESAPRILGVPRHLYRELAGELLRMATRRSSHRRFFHQLRALRVAGAMVESWST